MRIILNDSCCLIDLRKVGLLTKVLNLPYRMAVVYPLRAQELLGIPEHEWASLEDAGLEVIDVSGELVAEAEQAKRLVRGPSFTDCLSFVQARALGHGSILLTNDRKLRELALRHQVEVHGTLWLLDELLRHALLSATEANNVLLAWDNDALVFLPKAEVQQRLFHYQGHGETSTAFQKFVPDLHLQRSAGVGPAERLGGAVEVVDKGQDLLA